MSHNEELFLADWRRQNFLKKHYCLLQLWNKAVKIRRPCLTNQSTYIYLQWLSKCWCVIKDNHTCNLGMYADDLVSITTLLNISIEELKKSWIANYERIDESCSFEMTMAIRPLVPTKARLILFKQSILMWQLLNRLWP